MISLITRYPNKLPALGSGGGVDLPAWMTSGEGSVGHFHPNSLAFSKKGPTTVASILGFVERTVQENQRHGHSLDQDPRPGRSKSFHLTDLSDDIIDLFCNDSNIDSESLEPIPLFPTTSEVNIQAETTFPTLSLSPPAAPPLPSSERKHKMPQAAGIKQPAKKRKLSDDSSHSFCQGMLWNTRFDELCDFAKLNGHCQVPHSYTKSPSLGRWVKRQRYQYKLRLENKSSNMTEERIAMLEKIGFVWDSHVAAWELRMNELINYSEVYGHCNVPATYTFHQGLAVWVKRQRQQYKFFKNGKPSCMTEERIAALENIGFEWELRKRGPKS